DGAANALKIPVTVRRAGAIFTLFPSSPNRAKTNGAPPILRAGGWAGFRLATSHAVENVLALLRGEGMSFRIYRLARKIRGGSGYARALAQTIILAERARRAQLYGLRRMQLSPRTTTS